MNYCFVSGEIISPINYSFVYNSKKHMSVLTFTISINTFCGNRTQFTVKAYDEKADFVYRFFSEKDFVCICGWINSKINIIIEEIEHISST
ncbi:MAG: hypothetical protein Q4G09_00540 [Clostridia bacterium]|nr:hypothetical protein [Clostridia bacterium]